MAEKKKPSWLAVAAAVAIVFAVGVYYVVKDNGAEAGMDPRDGAKVALGGRIYADNCASCHGADLKGQPDWRQRLPNGRLPAPPHDETGHTWHHPGEQLFALTKFGPAALAGGGYQSDMPGYEGKLSDAEIWAVLSYIKSRWPREIQARHDQMSQR